MTDSQLFPHFVCRVAGVPVGGLEDLAAAESVTTYRALRELEAELGPLRGPLSEALFEAVGGLDENAAIAFNCQPPRSVFASASHGRFGSIGLSTMRSTCSWLARPSIGSSKRNVCVSSSNSALTSELAPS